MGEAIISEKDGVTSIQCTRGAASAAAKKTSIVEDKQGNKYFCRMTKIRFNQQQDNYGVEVFDEKGRSVKKFLKGYLKFVKEIDDN